MRRDSWLILVDEWGLGIQAIAGRINALAERPKIHEAKLEEA